MSREWQAPASWRATAPPTATRLGRGAAASQTVSELPFADVPDDRSCGPSLACRLGSDTLEPGRNCIERQQRLIARPRPDDVKTGARHHHFGHQETAVVGRTHDRAIGPGNGERDEVALVERRHEVAAVE